MFASGLHADGRNGNWWNPADWFDEDQAKYEVDDKDHYQPGDTKHYSAPGDFDDNYYQSSNRTNRMENQDFSEADASVYTIYTVRSTKDGQNSWQSNNSRQGMNNQSGMSANLNQLSGKIASIQNVEFSKGNQTKACSVATVELDQGPTLLMTLGHDASLESLDLEEGDRVQVSGQSGEIGDSLVFVADSIRANGKYAQLDNAVAQIAGRNMNSSQRFSQNQGDQNWRNRGSQYNQSDRDQYSQYDRSSQYGQSSQYRQSNQYSTNVQDHDNLDSTGADHNRYGRSNRYNESLSDQNRNQDRDYVRGSMDDQSRQYNWNNQNDRSSTNSWDNDQGNRSSSSNNWDNQNDRSNNSWNNTQRNAYSSSTYGYNRTSNDAEIQGKVENFRNISLQGEKDSHRLVRIRMQDGETKIVNLGPETRLSDLDLQSGDQVSIKGQEKTIDGRTVIFADQVKVDGREKLSQ